MADNTTLDPGAGGDVIATDDVAGVKYQRVKLVDGTLDSTAAIGGDATNGLDVDVTRVQGTVTVDSELPAAAALSDTTGNPTSPMVGAGGMVWDGVQWLRARGDATNGLDVDVTRVPADPFGADADAAATAGSTGSMQAKFRLMTSQLDSIRLAVQTIDNPILVDDAPFGAGATGVNMAGFVFDEVAGGALTENDAAAARVDAKRALVGTLEDATTRGQRAAVSAAGRLSVDASGVAVPITDNAGTLTVDAPVATPVNVQIGDGTDTATVLPVRTVPATTEKSVNVNVLPSRANEYQVVTGEVAPAITIGVKELFNFFHPAAVTQDVYIMEIGVSFVVTTASTTAGRTSAELFKSTAVGTGGTNVGAADIGGGLGTSAVQTNAAANLMQVKTGGGTLGVAVGRFQTILTPTSAVGVQQTIQMFKSTSFQDAIVMRGGSADGINIQVNRIAAHTALVDQWLAYVRWIEL